MMLSLMLYYKRDNVSLVCGPFRSSTEAKADTQMQKKKKGSIVHLKSENLTEPGPDLLCLKL